MQKSKATSFILCFLFGPLGLFYTHGFLIPLVLVLVALFLSATIVVPVGIWILSMIVGPAAIPSR